MQWRTGFINSCSSLQSSARGSWLLAATVHCLVLVRLHLHWRNLPLAPASFCHSMIGSAMPIRQLAAMTYWVVGVNLTEACKKKINLILWLKNLQATKILVACLFFKGIFFFYRDWKINGMVLHCIWYSEAVFHNEGNWDFKWIGNLTFFFKYMFICF